MGKSNKHTVKLKEYILKVTMRGELDNDGLVQIIELCKDIGNIKSISQYAKDNSMSYNGVKKHREVVELLGCKFVFDND